MKKAALKSGFELFFEHISAPLDSLYWFDCGAAVLIRALSLLELILMLFQIHKFRY